MANTCVLLQDADGIRIIVHEKLKLITFPLQDKISSGLHLNRFLYDSVDPFHALRGNRNIRPR